MTRGGLNGLPFVFFFLICEPYGFRVVFIDVFIIGFLKGISLIEFPLLLVKVARIKEKRKLYRLRFLFQKIPLINIRCLVKEVLP